jgi:transcription initiation factor TFIIIB Brf1 subunit/transcription initiation factor TFIIB
MRCPICKRKELRFSTEAGMFEPAGEAYCPDCGHITKSALNVTEKKGE